MTKVTASEFQKNFGKYQAQAQREPVTVTSHGRDSVVLINAEDFNRLVEMKEAITEEDKELIYKFMQRHKHTIEKLAQ